MDLSTSLPPVSSLPSVPSGAVQPGRLFGRTPPVDPGTFCPPEEDVCRQEFKADCDINTVLNRFGGVPEGRRSPIFSEVDHDDDLATAYASVAAMRRDFEALPANVREHFGSWLAFAQAATTPEQANRPAGPTQDAPVRQDGNLDNPANN